jgi:hypothetical protein
MEEVENGILVGGDRIIYPYSIAVMKQVVSIPEGVTAMKYYYTDENGFVKIPDPVPEQSESPEVTEMKVQLGIIPPYGSPTTLSEEKANKTYELSKACESEILSGFYSTARGASEWYTNSRDDQTNLMGQITLATLVPTFMPQWKSSTESICSDFTLEQITKVATDGGLFKTERIKVYDTLKAQVLSATTVEEVNAVVWQNKVW